MYTSEECAHLTRRQAAAAAEDARVPSRSVTVVKKDAVTFPNKTMMKAQIMSRHTRTGAVPSAAQRTKIAAPPATMAMTLTTTSASQAPGHVTPPVTTPAVASRRRSTRTDRITVQQAQTQRTLFTSADAVVAPPYQDKSVPPPLANSFPQSAGTWVEQGTSSRLGTHAAPVSDQHSPPRILTSEKARRKQKTVQENTSRDERRDKHTRHTPSRSDRHDEMTNTARHSRPVSSRSTSSQSSGSYYYAYVYEDEHGNLIACSETDSALVSTPSSSWYSSSSERQSARTVDAIDGASEEAESRLRSRRRGDDGEGGHEKVTRTERHRHHHSRTKPSLAQSVDEKERRAERNSSRHRSRQNGKATTLSGVSTSGAAGRTPTEERRGHGGGGCRTPPVGSAMGKNATTPTTPTTNMSSSVARDVASVYASKAWRFAQLSQLERERLILALRCTPQQKTTESLNAASPHRSGANHHRNNNSSSTSPHTSLSLLGESGWVSAELFYRLARGVVTNKSALKTLVSSCVGVVSQPSHTSMASSGASSRASPAAVAAEWENAQAMRLVYLPDLLPFLLHGQSVPENLLAQSTSTSCLDDVLRVEVTAATTETLFDRKWRFSQPYFPVFLVVGARRCQLDATGAIVTMPASTPSSLGLNEDRTPPSASLPCRPLPQQTSTHTAWLLFAEDLARSLPAFPLQLLFTVNPNGEVGSTPPASAMPYWQSWARTPALVRAQPHDAIWPVISLYRFAVLMALWSCTPFDVLDALEDTGGEALHRLHPHSPLQDAVAKAGGDRLFRPPSTSRVAWSTLAPADRQAASRHGKNNEDTDKDDHAASFPRRGTAAPNSTDSSKYAPSRPNTKANHAHGSSSSGSGGNGFAAIVPTSSSSQNYDIVNPNVAAMTCTSAPASPPLTSPLSGLHVYDTRVATSAPRSGASFSTPGSGVYNPSRPQSAKPALATPRVSDQAAMRPLPSQRQHSHNQHHPHRYQIASPQTASGQTGQYATTSYGEDVGESGLTTPANPAPWASASMSVSSPLMPSPPAGPHGAAASSWTGRRTGPPPQQHGTSTVASVAATGGASGGGSSLGATPHPYAVTEAERMRNRYYNTSLCSQPVTAPRPLSASVCVGGGSSSSTGPNARHDVPFSASYDRSSHSYGGVPTFAAVPVVFGDPATASSSADVLYAVTDLDTCRESRAATDEAVERPGHLGGHDAAAVGVALSFDSNTPSVTPDTFTDASSMERTSVDTAPSSLSALRRKRSGKGQADQRAKGDGEARSAKRPKRKGNTASPSVSPSLTSSSQSSRRAGDVQKDITTTATTTKVRDGRQRRQQSPSLTRSHCDAETPLSVHNLDLKRPIGCALDLSPHCTPLSGLVLKPTSTSSREEATLSTTSGAPPPPPTYEEAMVLSNAASVPKPPPSSMIALSLSRTHSFGTASPPSSAVNRANPTPTTGGTAARSVHTPTTSTSHSTTPTSLGASSDGAIIPTATPSPTLGTESGTGAATRSSDERRSRRPRHSASAADRTDVTSAALWASTEASLTSSEVALVSPNAAKAVGEGEQNTARDAVSRPLSAHRYSVQHDDRTDAAHTQHERHPHHSHEEPSGKRHSAHRRSLGSSKLTRNSSTGPLTADASSQETPSSPDTMRSRTSSTTSSGTTRTYSVTHDASTPPEAPIHGGASDGTTRTDRATYPTEENRDAGAYLPAVDMNNTQETATSTAVHHGERGSRSETHTSTGKAPSRWPDGDMEPWQREMVQYGLPPRLLDACAILIQAIARGYQSRRALGWRLSDTHQGGSDVGRDTTPQQTAPPVPALIYPASPLNSVPTLDIANLTDHSNSGSGAGGGGGGGGATAAQATHPRPPAVPAGGGGESNPWHGTETCQGGEEGEEAPTREHASGVPRLSASSPIKTVVTLAAPPPLMAFSRPAEARVRGGGGGATKNAVALVNPTAEMPSTGRAPALVASAPRPPELHLSPPDHYDAISTKTATSGGGGGGVRNGKAEQDEDDDAPQQLLPGVRSSLAPTDKTSSNSNSGSGAAATLGTSGGRIRSSASGLDDGRSSPKGMASTMRHLLTSLRARGVDSLAASDAVYASRLTSSTRTAVGCDQSLVAHTAGGDSSEDAFATEPGSFFTDGTFTLADSGTAVFFDRDRELLHTVRSAAAAMALATTSESSAGTPQSVLSDGSQKQQQQQKSPPTAFFRGSVKASRWAVAHMQMVGRGYLARRRVATLRTEHHEEQVLDSRLRQLMHRGPLSASSAYAGSSSGVLHGLAPDMNTLPAVLSSDVPRLNTATGAVAAAGSDGSHVSAGGQPAVCVSMDSSPSISLAGVDGESVGHTSNPGLLTPPTRIVDLPIYIKRQQVYYPRPDCWSAEPVGEGGARAGDEATQARRPQTRDTGGANDDVSVETPTLPSLPPAPPVLAAPSSTPMNDLDPPEASEAQWLRGANAEPTEERGMTAGKDAVASTVVDARPFITPPTQDRGPLILSPSPSLPRPPRMDAPMPFPASPLSEAVEQAALSPRESTVDASTESRQLQLQKDIMQVARLFLAGAVSGPLVPPVDDPTPQQATSAMTSSTEPTTATTANGSTSLTSPMFGLNFAAPSMVFPLSNGVQESTHSLTSVPTFSRNMSSTTAVEKLGTGVGKTALDDSHHLDRMLAALMQAPQPPSSVRGVTASPPHDPAALPNGPSAMPASLSGGGTTGGGGGSSSSTVTSTVNSPPSRLVSGGGELAADMPPITHVGYVTMRVGDDGMPPQTISMTHSAHHAGEAPLSGLRANRTSASSVGSNSLSQPPLPPLFPPAPPPGTLANRLLSTGAAVSSPATTPALSPASDIMSGGVAMNAPEHTLGSPDGSSPHSAADTASSRSSHLTSEECSVDAQSPVHVARATAAAGASVSGMDSSVFRSMRSAGGSMAYSLPFSFSTTGRSGMMGGMGLGNTINALAQTSASLADLFNLGYSRNVDSASRRMKSGVLDEEEDVESTSNTSVSLISPTPAPATAETTKAIRMPPLEVDADALDEEGEKAETLDGAAAQADATSTTTPVTATEHNEKQALSSSSSSSSSSSTSSSSSLNSPDRWGDGGGEDDAKGAHRTALVTAMMTANAADDALLEHLGGLKLTDEKPPLSAAEACALIQRTGRGYLSREHERFLLILSASGPEVSLLHRVARGFQVRRQLSLQLYVFKLTKQEMGMWDRRHKAAIDLQRVARGFVARQKTKRFQRKLQTHMELRTIMEEPNPDDD